MKITIVSPAAANSLSGNETTAQRWAQMLTELGHHAEITNRWMDAPGDALLALHAKKSHDSIGRFAAAYPKRPCIVGLSGTDIYVEGILAVEAVQSMAVATHLVALQPLALEEIPADYRRKGRVIYQSVQSPAPALGSREEDFFDVAIMAHLREVKDPLRPAFAARQMPAISRLRVVHMGGAMDRVLAEQTQREVESNRRFITLGNLKRQNALERLGQCHVFVNSSLREGGANAVGEAIAASVPVIASHIPGNIGLLGPEHPAYFPPRDTDALAQLLRRAEEDADFLRAIKGNGDARKHLFEPARELAAWDALLQGL